MKLQYCLKASVLLALVIAGRFARDVEQTNPGRSITDILRSTTAAKAPAALRAQPLRVVPVAATLRPAPLVVRPQTASFAEVE